MDKKQRKNGFLRGKTKTKKKLNRKKRNNLRQAFCGNRIDKKPLKMQENNHFGLFCTKQKHRNTEIKKQNHQNQKNDLKNTFLHSGKPPPMFVKFLFFFQVTLSHVCKAVLC